MSRLSGWASPTLGSPRTFRITRDSITPLGGTDRQVKYIVFDPIDFISCDEYALVSEEAIAMYYHVAQPQQPIALLGGPLGITGPSELARNSLRFPLCSIT